MIDLIITKMREIATAYTYIQGFGYESVFEMNGAPNRQYPFLLVNDTPDFRVQDIYRGNGLSNKTIWTLRVFLYDTYNQAERSETERASKQNELKTAMDRYLAECKDKMLKDLGYLLEIQSGFVAKRQHNPKLEQCSVTITILGKNTCDLGVFEYGE